MIGPYRRVYAIGDIHGHAKELHRLLAQIDDDGYDHLLDHIVFLGDYVDRGPHSSLVVETVQGLVREYRATALRGNHEQMLIDAHKAGRDTFAWCSWWYQGGKETAVSYSNATQRVPRDVVRWMGGLPLYTTIGDFVFVHAGIRPGVPLDKQSPEDMLWIREEFFLAEGDVDSTVVYGHTPRLEPDVRPGKVGIDTILKSGVLTAACVEGDKALRFITSASEEAAS